MPAWAPLRTALAPLHTQLGDDLPALDRDAVWLTRALATPVIQRHVPFSQYMRSASAWLLCNE